MPNKTGGQELISRLGLSRHPEGGWFRETCRATESLPGAALPPRFAGAWFGAEVRAGGDYDLVGCTVAPGFDFTDFELGNRAELLAAYPNQRQLILRLTRG